MVVIRSFKKQKYLIIKIACRCFYNLIFCKILVTRPLKISDNTQFVIIHMENSKRGKLTSSVHPPISFIFSASSLSWLRPCSRSPENCSKFNLKAASRPRNHFCWLSDQILFASISSFFMSI